jgi:hypothetical protein
MSTRRIAALCGTVADDTDAKLSVLSLPIALPTSPMGMLAAEFCVHPRLTRATGHR